ncbi:MAG: aminoglycoside phosphotransferase family protein [Actinomycetota bacterium]|nr:aminoglycoside phosphotransferase family protein [Actinomycetota bacterium]
MPEPLQLSDAQRAALHQWLPGLQVVTDHSWGLVDTRVLHVRHDGRDLVVKAAGPDNHHIGREITAHRQWVGCLAEEGRAARLVEADERANILVTEYLPGDLVEGTEVEWHEDAYAQAGRLLARFHRQSSQLEPDYEQRLNARATRWLDGAHAIAPETEVRLRAEIDAFPLPARTVVPTHGDYQPRNWLHHGGVIAVIDFGRAELRAPETDFARLASQQLLGRPELERAFLDGYGADPREPGAWRRTRLREAIGTACWSHQVGDVRFEAQGHRMIADLLGE